ncbi:hypothetical protein ABZS86_20880 [Streptomyces sp. NPDC005355]|uniref:hypothetical protein n=1 Tax=Streptomyces sp. NPDC005355 TaxID=3157038 RepID=UPI0033ABE699
MDDGEPARAAQPALADRPLAGREQIVGPGDGGEVGWRGVGGGGVGLLGVGLLGAAPSPSPPLLRSVIT